MDEVKTLVELDDEQLRMVIAAVSAMVDTFDRPDELSYVNHWKPLLSHLKEEANSGEHCVLVDLHVTEVKAIIKALAFGNFIVAQRKFEGMLDWFEEHHLKENNIMIKIDHIKQAIGALEFSSVHNHFTEEERHGFITIKKFLEATLEAVKG